MMITMLWPAVAIFHASCGFSSSGSCRFQDRKGPGPAPCRRMCRSVVCVVKLTTVHRAGGHASRPLETCGTQRTPRARVGRATLHLLRCCALLAASLSPLRSTPPRCRAAYIGEREAGQAALPTTPTTVPPRSRAGRRYPKLQSSSGGESNKPSGRARLLPLPLPA